MALKNKSDNYLKITGCDLDTRIYFEIYRNENSRRSPDIFDAIIRDSEYVPELNQYLRNGFSGSASNTFNDVITKCYNCLKKLPGFSDWSDSL
jgi:hypothetical protein